MSEATEFGCMFCRIATGLAEASFVYRDDLVCAFLDIRPVTPGHILVVPTKHAVSLAEVPDDTSTRLFAVSRDLAGAVRRSVLRADGVNLFLADGEAAGQEVWHAHVHVIPRFAGDGFRISADAWRGPQPDRSQLDALAERIRAAV